MANHTFTFRRFTVVQDRCGMKVGTDGVLAGAWAPVPDGARTLLDIGTGTGLIALMLAQRFPRTRVDGLDIDHEACLQARENVSASPWPDRISVIEDSVQHFAATTTRRYDAIVTNPPFFVDSLKNPDPRRAAARHADSLSFAQLVKAASVLLNPGGVFSAIVPDEVLSRFEAEASLSGFFLWRHCRVKTVERKPPRRHLLAWARHRPADFDDREVTLSAPSGERSEWYRSLTSEFYL